MLRGFRARSLSKFEKPILDAKAEDASEQQSTDGTSSSASFERFCADMVGDGTLLVSFHDTAWDGDESTTSTSVDSSPLVWPRNQKSRLGKLHSLPKSLNPGPVPYDGRKGMKTDDAEASELDLMKERFAKLLLGEDLSGGGRGVPSALAISNAITNLSVSVFGELYRLEPLDYGRKARWTREMGWLLLVSDYIVEFVPSMQSLPDGGTIEVMVTRPRSDLQMNLPALGKLDSMLIEALDGFRHTEFWYVDQSVAIMEDGAKTFNRQEDKWWLPVPRLPPEGLSLEAKKHLQQQRESINQILKAALAINAQILSEMEVPMAYWEALPKNGRSSLGEVLYRIITAESFSPDVLLSSIDSRHEHNILELVNRVEAAIHIWRRKLQTRLAILHSKDGGKGGSRTSWAEGATDLERREVLAEKAMTLLILTRQKFPGLPQSILDMGKIQHNKDVGQAILESYSRVIESLAFNILSRIDDVIHADDAIKGISNRFQPQLPTGMLNSGGAISSTSPVRSLQSRSLSDFLGWDGKEVSVEAKKQDLTWNPAVAKLWSYSSNVMAMQSPPSRD